jgi:hypothetical protein
MLSPTRDETTSESTLAAAAVAPEAEEDEEETASPRTDSKKITWIDTERLWSDSSKDVASAIDALYNLVVENEPNHVENQNTAFRNGATLAVVKAMKRHGDSLAIQTNGCYLLGAFTFCKLDRGRVHQAIVEVGGLKACLFAMERYPNNLFVQAAGCHLIGNLWCCLDVRKDVVDGGGLTKVLQAMDKYKGEKCVQSWGCYALSSLSSTRSKALVDAGCIEIVIPAMENHPDDAVLQMHACQFLSIIAKHHKDYRNRIIDAKGLTAVAEARRVHKDKANLVSKANIFLKVTIA